MRRYVAFEARLEVRDLSDGDLGLLLVRLRRDLANGEQDGLPVWLQQWWAIRLEAAEKEWEWRRRAERNGGPTLQRMHFREWLDALKARVNLVDLVGKQVALRRSGREYKGLCPFHQEQTPSFSVDAERGLYHCFGCGAGGDLLTWVEAMETPNGDFAEAVRWLERGS